MCRYILPLSALVVLTGGCAVAYPSRIAPFTPGAAETALEGATPAPEEDCGWVVRTDAAGNADLYYCCPGEGLQPRCVEASFISLKGQARD